MFVIDDREPKNLIERLDRSAFVARLEYGDIKIWGFNGLQILIERKTVSDLLSSMSSRRIYRQIRGLIQEADVPILLIEGFMSSYGSGKVRYRNGESGWRWVSIQNILLSFQLHGLKVIYSTNQDMTVRMLRSLESYFRKPDHSVLDTPPEPLFTIGEPATRKVKMLMCLPGIGEEMAGRLLDRFDTIEGIVSANKEEIEEVYGIGEKTADKILQVVKEP